MNKKENNENILQLQNAFDVISKTYDMATSHGIFKKTNEVAYLHNALILIKDFINKNNKNENNRN